MNWKRRGRIFGLALLGINFVAANAGYSIGPAQAGASDPVLAGAARHAALTAAETQARAHLAKFLDIALDDRGMARDNAAIKIVLTADGTREETVWVAPFGLLDGRYVGLLVNEPKAMDTKHIGDAVAFDESQVRDWYFFGDDGKMYGSYTTRALLPTMSPKSARQITRILAPTPVPAHW